MTGDRGGEANPHLRRSPRLLSARARYSHPTSEPKLTITGSRQFVSWLREMRASLAFTTYQTGKLFLLGLQNDGRLSIFERTFERCMGLCAAGQDDPVSEMDVSTVAQRGIGGDRQESIEHGRSRVSIHAAQPQGAARGQAQAAGARDDARDR